MKDFDIILVSWNRFEYLKRTVASLVNSGAVKDCKRFIIVDNGSTEGGVWEFLEDLRKLYGAFIVNLPHNRGWGTAVNEALGLSRSPFLFVSNNDVEYKPGFHYDLFNTIDHHPNIGILGVWRHTAHSLVSPGTHSEWFREMTDVPAVGWMLSKEAMSLVGMLPEHGPCMTKGGNGEDCRYVQLMKGAGFLVGVTKEDVATHIDGY